MTLKRCHRLQKANESILPLLNDDFSPGLLTNFNTTNGKPDDLGLSVSGDLQ